MANIWYVYRSLNIFSALAYRVHREITHDVDEYADPEAFNRVPKNLFSTAFEDFLVAEHLVALPPSLVIREACS